MRLSQRKNPLVFTNVFTNLMRLSPRKNPLVFTNVFTNFHEVITKEEPTGIHKRCHQFPRVFHQRRTNWYSRMLSPISMTLSPRKNPLVFTNVVTNFHEVITKEEPTGMHICCHQFDEVITKEEPTDIHKCYHQFP